MMFFFYTFHTFPRSFQDYNYSKISRKNSNPYKIILYHFYCLFMGNKNCCCCRGECMRTISWKLEATEKKCSFKICKKLNSLQNLCILFSGFVGVRPKSYRANTEKCYKIERFSGVRGWVHSFWMVDIKNKCFITFLQVNFLQQG